MKMTLFMMLACIGIFLGVLNSSVSPVQASSPVGVSCNSCHQQELSVNLPDGDSLGIQIDSELFSASVHGELECNTCHMTFENYPHPDLKAENLRDYQSAQSEICESCHHDVYSEMDDSGHKIVWGEAIICTDCHNAHYMTTGQIAEAPEPISCEMCHSETAGFYLDSVHGGAVTKELNDLPYCTGCHTAHSFDTRPSRAESLALCISCHDDKALMEKYGISTTVVETYLQDFHGKTAVVESQQSGDPIESAICTDCHGVHDIQFTDSTNTLVKQDGSTICQKCHPGTDTKFASAWLSHCTPSLKKSSLVFVADWFYRLLIPFIVVGLLIHIVLDYRQSRRVRGGQHDDSH